MASEKVAFYVPMGALKAELNTTYTKDNLSSVVDTVVLVRGVRIVDENGKETPIRGARVKYHKHRNSRNCSYTKCAIYMGRRV